ncbi:MAG TPA: hypothetical protein VGJ60_01335 [Chloroflexota bacterium]|jgi:hypothetical protein
MRLLAAILALGGTVGCSVLLGPDATPVPGAAATLTRSINTPIPTPVRTPSVQPGASPSPARAAASALPSPSVVAGAQPLSEADVAAVQSRIEQTISTPALSGIDALLLDHVSLSTRQGGSVMDRAEAASWLRDHAAAGLAVSQVTRGTQDVMLQVQTDGWPEKDPIENGQVTFSLRRYDANGRQDESGDGEWKVDVIDAD